MATSGSMFDIFKAQLLLNQKENMVSGFIMLALFEFTTGILREVFSQLKKYLDTVIKKRLETKIVNTVISATPEQNELIFERNYKKGGDWNKPDAIIYRALQVPESRILKVIGPLEVVQNSKAFDIDKGVTFQLQNIRFDAEGEIVWLEFKLYSSTLSVCDLREYVEQQVEHYLVNKKNNLGNKLYYFDQISEKKHPRQEPPTRVTFSRHPFVTNRTLDNVFHERQQELQDRVDFFLNRKDWYDSRGIPHTLGLLLHGSPGTGKTSTIKAIANISRRHIININLSAIKTRKQLKKLFYDERIEVAENMNNTNTITEYIIPINKRVYVIEDIDAVEGEIALKRDKKVSSTPIFLQEPQPDRMIFTNELSDKETSDLDLATLLNIIDGTLETPGRILIISSNYPEKLDDALIRPGRIDMLIEYKKCNKTVLADMYESFYEQQLTKEQLEKLEEYKWSPAEVGQLLFKNFANPDNALHDLTELNPDSYFKFGEEPVDEVVTPMSTPADTPTSESNTSMPTSKSSTPTSKSSTSTPTSELSILQPLEQPVLGWRTDTQTTVLDNTYDSFNDAGYAVADPNAVELELANPLSTHIDLDLSRY